MAHDYGRFIYSLAYRLTGKHHDAQDLVQGFFEYLLGGKTTNPFGCFAIDRRRQKT